MSVLKRNRKPSKFEVFNNFYKMRREITEFLLRDFGYDNKKALKKIERMFQNRKYEELSEEEKLNKKEFEEWYNSWFYNHYKIMSKQQRKKHEWIIWKTERGIKWNIQLQRQTELSLQI